MPFPTEQTSLSPAFAPPVVRFTYHRYAGFPWLQKALIPVKNFCTRLLQAEENDPLPFMTAIFAMVLVGFSIYLFMVHMVYFFFLVPVALALIGLGLLLATGLSSALVTMDATNLTISRRLLPVPDDFPWRSLISITFARNGKPSLEANELVLYYTDGRKLSLELNALSQETLTALINIALFYNSRTQIWPLEARAAIGRREKDEIDPFDFTELWQSNLERRFAPTSFVPLEQGQKLLDGQLTILGQIASGGMSAVYLAQHQRFKTVVLKESVLPGNPSSEASVKAAELFKRESLLLSGLSHPRIVKIFDYFVEDGRYYLMLEHIPGRTLRTFVKEKGAVAENIIIDWGLQMARILDYLHKLETPVVHRDFTPENLILSADAKIKVIDFGASSTFLSTATGTVIGKIAYMAPEQIKGKTSPESDIYSLGGVLFYLTTGEDPKPYEGNALAAEVKARSPRLARLIADCMRADKHERIHDTTELIRRLEEARQDNKARVH
ncbi:MAG: serine/threonine protein kinase [Cyanobacteria bacterium SZAS LIN-2]|nr:serine/threonine protein kinase [Cyanobacteria bacterium SZAS LIN-2]